MTPSTTVERAGSVVVAANQSANLTTHGDNAQGGVLAAGVVKAYTDISGSVSAGCRQWRGDRSEFARRVARSDRFERRAGSTDTKADAYGIAAGDGSSASADIDPSVSAVFGSGAEAFVSGDVSIETSMSGASSAKRNGFRSGRGRLACRTPTRSLRPRPSRLSATTRSSRRAAA